MSDFAWNTHPDYLAKLHPPSPPSDGSADHEPIRIPCEWICPDCKMMETDELARDEHECPPNGAGEQPESPQS